MVVNIKLNKEKSQGFERIISSPNFKKAALLGLLLLTLVTSGCSVSDPNTIEISSRDIPPIPILTPTGKIALETTGPVKEKSADFKRN